MSSDPSDSNTNDSAADRTFPDGSPPTPKRRNWWWVFGIVAVLCFVALIICCGVMTYGFSKFGWRVFEPVRMELNEIAQVQQSAGRVEKLTINFGESTKEGQSNPGFVVLDAETANGPYQFSIKIGTEAQIEQGFLIRPDGTREELKLGQSGDRPIESDSPSNPTGDPTDNPTVDESPSVPANVSPPSD